MTTEALLLAGSLLYAWHVLAPNTGWVPFISTAPWLLVLMRGRAWSYRRVCLVFGVTFYGVSLLATPWLRSFTVLGWILAPLFYLPFFILAPLLTHHLLRIRPTVPLLVVWPLAFTTAEWLRIRMSAGEVPLLQLGTGLVSHSTLAQVADLTGVSGLTALACMTAALAAMAAHTLLRGERGRPELRTLGLQALAVGLVLTGIWTYGKVRLSQAEFRRGPTVLVIQHDFHGWMTPSDAARQHADLVRLTRAGVAGRDVDIVVWPENTVASLDPADPLLSRIQALARQLDVAILVDGPSTSPAGVVHHTTALVSGERGWPWYDKVALVPWSEYLPFAPALRRVSPASAEAFGRLVRFSNPHFVGMDPGERVHTLAFHGREGERYDVATPICYEALSPRLVASFFSESSAPHAGAFVLNPVSERLLGGPIHEQTLALTRLRAIENRVTIMRASNNGISAAIDPDGRPYAWVKKPGGGYAVDQAGYFVADVILDGRFGTVYTRVGDWLPASFLVCLLVMMWPGRRGTSRHHAEGGTGSARGAATPS
ncbi:MAG TPA: apolipoprotein N-acyltransferase [Longimicrobiaceae bacterium]|nr:apolipoprotein N-acyltransferase [Longimicrobiaceae bacterium]